ncbi:biotin synthase [Rhodoferax sp.]|uniref:biotin synthase n=1 Tax=Rhodoferax sp. TaxID=50421 RepID=UPI002ACEB86C|nr:biotin synthase [Rhodoferax sp.]MDZ7918888.1 biotin synthase [Rhodoferax sp.]
MSSQRPPTIDPVAATRWATLLPRQSESPWLHEEVARRMEERLQWIVQKPQRWVHWGALQGGLQAQGLLGNRYPDSECFVLESTAERAQAALKLIAKPWWSPGGWGGPKVKFRAPAQPVQMVWANMALHTAADPEALIAEWHRLIAVDGFAMFSCLGPDTLRELRSVYARMGWPVPSHEFTDMHDWGDMLVHAGFAEPVMDMERITLTYSTPQSLLAELRGLGRNLHPQRFGGLRSRAWLDRLHAALTEGLASPAGDGRLQLTFEVVYGHAFKPAPRLHVQAETTVSLEQMRAVLKHGPAGSKSGS